MIHIDDKDKIKLPDGAKLVKNGEYFQIRNVPWHPISDRNGSIPLHRFILFESIDGADPVACHWCKYPLRWKTKLACQYLHVVNADHLDGDKSNNSPENIVPSCYWCNINRLWAEKHPNFWPKWLRWMQYTPPAMRPFLPDIAAEYGIEAFNSDTEQ